MTEYVHHIPRAVGLSALLTRLGMTRRDFREQVLGCEKTRLTRILNGRQGLQPEDIGAIQGYCREVGISITARELHGLPKPEILPMPVRGLARTIRFYVSIGWRTEDIAAKVGVTYGVVRWEIDKLRRKYGRARTTKELRIYLEGVGMGLTEAEIAILREVGKGDWVLTSPSSGHSAEWLPATPQGDSEPPASPPVDMLRRLSDHLDLLEVTQGKSHFGLASIFSLTRIGREESKKKRRHRAL